MTHAVWWIKAMIHDHILRFFSQVKLGTTKLRRDSSTGQLGCPQKRMSWTNISPSSPTHSARLDADPQQIEEIISRLTNRDQSLDSPMTDGSDTSFLDFLETRG